MELLSSAKVEWMRSNADRRHPFRLFSLATLGDYPEVRTVVKRRTLADLSTIFFTDSRSPKVEQIRKNKNVSALFYHPKKKLQVRIKGEASFIETSHSDYKNYLEQAKKTGTLRDYTTAYPPGTYIRDFSAISYVDEIYFLPICIFLKQIDVLQLAHDGHQRALYINKWGEWIEKILNP